MKTWRWIVVFLASGALMAACTTSSPSEDDNGSGVGGSGSGGSGTGGSGVTTNTTSTSTSTSTSTTTTGPVGCDTGQGMDFGSPECVACIQCTQTSDCQTEWSVCTMGQPCGDFITCLDDCDTQCGSDETCFDTCVGLDTETTTCVATSGCIGNNAQGCNDYLTALSCSVCQFCPGDCDAANNCS